MLGYALSTVARVTSRALHHVGQTPLWRSASDPRIVLYHGIGTSRNACLRHLKDEIPEATIDQQLAFLRRHYQVVSFADALTTDNACTLTFDDGLASIYDWLLTRRVPATVFVNSSVLDGQTLLWQHQLSYLMTEYGVDHVADALGLTDVDSGFQVIDRCQHAFSTVAPHMIGLMARFGEDEATVARHQAIYLTPAQLRDLHRAGVTIGSHTDRHLPLASVPHDVMRGEIDRARTALEPFGATVLSFPFGMRCDYGEDALTYALEHYPHVLEVGDGANPERGRTLARVGLGSQHQTDYELYAAIEVQPTIKRQIRRLRH